MVENSCELKQKKRKTKMDGGTKAVQAVSQNFFQTPQYLPQFSNGMSRFDGLVTGFAQEYGQSVLTQHRAKENYSHLTGPALSSAANHENAQNLHQGNLHQLLVPYSYANLRQPEFQQHSSGASNSTTSNETQFKYQQQQNYYATLHYERVNNILPQSLHAQTSSQQIAYHAMQNQATLANRQHVTTTGLGQSAYDHQPPTYAASMAHLMTLESKNQCSQLASALSRPLSNPHQKERSLLLKPVKGKQSAFPLIPKEVQRQLHLRSQSMKLNAYTETRPQFPSGTPNRFCMIPSLPPNAINYLAANGYSGTPVASDSNASSAKDSPIPSPRNAPIVQESESCASNAFQFNKLQPAVRDGQTFGTSSTSAIVQNPNAVGRIPVQRSSNIDGLNSIAECAKNTVDLPVNSIDQSMVKENSEVTGDDLIKLHNKVMNMREQFIHLLRNYKQQYLKFNSVNGDPASHEPSSNILINHDKNISDANRSVLPDNAPNFHSAPATFSSQSDVLMTKNSPKANHNSHQGRHLNQTLGSVRESNQLDKILHVMKDSPTMTSPVSLLSTIKEKPNIDQSHVKNCQPSNQKDSLLVDQATEHLRSNKDITSQSKPIQSNLETASTSPSQFNNQKDMSHHYRVTINSLLDKLDSYSTITSVDAEEPVSVTDGSRSESVIQIKTEPCESVTENTKVNNSEFGEVMQIKIKTEQCDSETEDTKVDSSESGNIMQIKTDDFKSVMNKKSLHLETCVLSEPTSNPLCPPESSQFQARDVPLLLAEEVPCPHLKIESVCSLVEGNTFYNSHVAHVFGAKNVPESNDLDTLSNNTVKPQIEVETNILPNIQCFRDSKGLSDLPLQDYRHLSQTTETNKREGDLSHIQDEPDKPLSLAIAQPLEDNVCAKDTRSEPSLYSQLSELLRAFPFGIEQTESAPLAAVDEGTEKKGVNDIPLSKKLKGQNVQKNKILPQKSFPVQNLLMNQSLSIALDKCDSTELLKEIPVQMPATGGHIHVTVVDSKKIIINVIESQMEQAEETSLKKNPDVSGFHSAMTKIVIQANEQSLGDPCGKQENVLDSDDEVVWVKTEAPPRTKSTTSSTPNKHKDGSSMGEPLEKDVSLHCIGPEITEKSDCNDYPVPKPTCGPDPLLGCKKIKKASRLIVKTDFLKSKHPRLMGPLKSGETKTAKQGGVKVFKNDKTTVTNVPSLNTDFGIQKHPETTDESLSTAAEDKLSIDSLGAGKTHTDLSAKSDTHCNSTLSKANTQAQLIQEYFQHRREESMGAGKKTAKNNKGAICHNTNPLIPNKKPSVDLGKLKQIVMRASENDVRENVSKHMQSVEITENNMPPSTTDKVSSPTSTDLIPCVTLNRLEFPENNPTPKHIFGPNHGKETSDTSATKSPKPISKDFIKRVACLGNLNGVITLSTLYFPLLKGSDRKRKQGSVNTSLTKKPKTTILQSVPGESQMLEFKLCPDLLMGGHLAAIESTGGKHRSGVEDGSPKGIDNETEDCSNIPFKKRKVDMTEFHGSVVLQESTTVGQMTHTAKRNGPSAASSSQDLFNTYKKIYLDKQKTGLPNLS